MPDKLPHAPAHQTGEAPASYASRIALAHGLTVQELCSDFKIRFHELPDGVDTAVGRIAALGGADRAALAACAFVRTSEHEFRHRGQMLRRESLVKGRVAVCPRCLVDDAQRAGAAPTDAAYFCRADWLLDIVDTCPVHRCEITTVLTIDHAAFRADFSNLLAAQPIDLEALAEKATDRPPTELQDYALARLNGLPTASAPFLDEMPLFAAVRTCEMLGAAACFGSSAKRDELDPDRLRAAQIRGFEIGIQGRDAVKELLGKMAMAHARRRERVQDQVARQSFEAIYSYLHVNPERPNRRLAALSSFRSVVSDFIMANFPLKPGDKVLGETISERNLHSVTSLAKEAHCGPDRVRKVLILGGLIREDQAEVPNANILFDAALGAQMLQESRSALSYDEASSYLGIGTYQVAMLVKAKLIQLTEAAQNGQHGAIHVGTLEAFVDRLLKNARTVEQKTGHQATLADASRRAMCTQVDIVRLISEGRLKWIGARQGNRYLGSILVDWQEVRSLIHELDRDTLSLRQFADQIHVRKQAAGALVAQGHVASVSKNCGGHPTIRIPVPEAIAFRQRYVSLGELACNRSQHHRTTKKALDEKGAKPAFDPDAVLAHIYPRDRTSI